MVLLHTQQTVKYFRVAPVAVWALDYCLTFEHEVCLFTSIGPSWNIATVLFIIARYSPIAWIINDIYVTLAPQLTMGTCLATYRAAGITIFLMLVATEGLLLIRTLALWHDNRKIKRILLTVYLLVVVSLVTCGILLEIPLKSVCVNTSTPSSVKDATRVERLIMGQFVSSALFELTAITATLYHSIRLRSTGVRTVSKLVSTLWKGSFLYALSLLVISVANIATLSLPISDGQNGMLDVFQGVLHGVLASRILFDLRAQAADRNEEHTSNVQLTSYVSRFTSQTPTSVPHENNA
ncbi:hypothetical protein K503DRAFT_565165 [Rhizopogon vinicolor AM-OR11-026]|uniref:DUF6533 domain-containing protein n=1 Tax=Rhizopogon vinicolor AM-OR11-026 TaxID=1314800 RepID=A0A1B7N7X1_9AGAM|nr:hypothetical protein K503DRAFT_565165 [Rhizopogon vinicolor AM-OR11-026]